MDSLPAEDKRARWTVKGGNFEYDPSVSAKDSGSSATQSAPLSPPFPSSLRKRNENNSISEAPIQPKLAFEYFAGSIYDTSNVDFSDAVSTALVRKVGSKQTAFVSSPANNKVFESPLERFSRLQSEIKAFREDLEELSDSILPAGNSNEQNPETVRKATGVADLATLMSNELANMEHDLMAISREQKFGPLFNGMLTSDAFILHQKAKLDKIVHGVTSFTSPCSSSSSSSFPSSSAASSLPSSSSSPSSSLWNFSGKTPLGVFELDQRVAKLENAVGIFTDATPKYPDMATALLQLYNKIELLDGTKLDYFYRRIKSLQIELDQVEQQKRKVMTMGPNSGSGVPPSVNVSVAFQEKVDAIHTLMTKWDKTSTQLPLVIARLQSLKELHERAAGAMVGLDNVNETQKSVAATLHENKKNLTTLADSFTENSKTMQENVGLLEQRIKVLAEKMDRLNKVKGV